VNNGLAVSININEDFSSFNSLWLRSVHNEGRGGVRGGGESGKGGGFGRLGNGGGLSLANEHELLLSLGGGRRRDVDIFARAVITVSIGKGVVSTTFQVGHVAS